MYNDTVIELEFKASSPYKFGTEIKPLIEVIKGMIPGTQRTYDPSTHKWTIAAEYWAALKMTAASGSFNFKITEVFDNASESTGDPFASVNVPKDYQDKFHYETTPVVTKEDAKSIAAKLSTYLGVTITTQELSELKKLYRQKARQLHPDINPDPLAAKEMSELNRLWTLYTAGGIN
jgi:hypothetical protein